MLNFKNDYNDIAHDNVLQALLNEKNHQNIGYGNDRHCQEAADLIRQTLHCDHAAVHFMMGGTMTNILALSSGLKSHEAIVCCKSGHIVNHEGGALEATGHQLILVDGNNGKMQVEQLKLVNSTHTNEFATKPKIVYISNSTETGTVYTKQELTDLYRYCQENDWYLYIDGARMGVALSSPFNDVAIEELPQLCDAFYFGGTKNGALFGEALVIINQELQTDFRYHMKQKGGMLSKGYLLGIQFRELFQGNLYFELASLANAQAQRLADALSKLSIKLVYPVESNQIFCELSQDVAQKLSAVAQFEIKSSKEDTVVARFVTHYQTTETMVDQLHAHIKAISASR